MSPLVRATPYWFQPFHKQTLRELHRAFESYITRDSPPIILRLCKVSAFLGVHLKLVVHRTRQLASDKASNNSNVCNKDHRLSIPQRAIVYTHDSALVRLFTCPCSLATTTTDNNESGGLGLGLTYVIAHRRNPRLFHRQVLGMASRLTHEAITAL